MDNDMVLTECEVVSTGRRVRLPLSAAERLAKIGAVRLPEPKPDLRYATPSPLPLASTWVGGRFNPGIGLIH